MKTSLVLERTALRPLEGLSIASSKQILGIFATFLFAAFAYAERGCERLVSLSPSVTEAIFAIGLGKNLIAGTRYDSFPPEARSLEKIGGFLDPNIESIVHMKPSLVVGLAEQADIAQKLSAVGLQTMLLEHRSLNGIVDSFYRLEKECRGTTESSQKKELEINEQLSLLTEKASRLTTKKVAIVVYREYDSPTLRDVYLSGTDGYYSDILRMINAENVFKAMTGNLSAASIEGLILLDPDIIIEMLPPDLMKERGSSKLMEGWKSASLLRAVTDNKVFLLDDDWATIPGPRFPILAQKLFELIHETK